jgi:hypothetical protein
MPPESSPHFPNTWIEKVTYAPGDALDINGHRGRNCTIGCRRSAAPVGLVGLTGSNSLAFPAAIVLLVAVAILAAWRPQYRASQTDPMTVLRSE